MTAKKVSFVYTALNTKIHNKLQNVYVKMVQQIDLEYCEYEKAFWDLYQITKITKYRDFQYRLLVNAIHPNNRLFIGR